MTINFANPRTIATHSADYCRCSELGDACPAHADDVWGVAWQADGARPAPQLSYLTKAVTVAEEWLDCQQ